MARAERWMGRVGDEVREVVWGAWGAVVWEDHAGWVFRLCVDFGFHSEGDGSLGGF